jgi:hypothetical protein
MQKLTSNIKVSDFSPHLFWDVDTEKIDLDKSRGLIVERVLEYGNMKDWELLQLHYGLEEIKNLAKNIKSLDEVTLSFLCNIFELKKEDFKCYIHRQSTPHFWNY